MSTLFLFQFLIFLLSVEDLMSFPIPQLLTLLHGLQYVLPLLLEIPQCLFPLLLEMWQKLLHRWMQPLQQLFYFSIQFKSISEPVQAFLACSKWFPVTCVRGSLPEVSKQAQCFLEQHTTIDWNTLMEHVLFLSFTHKFNVFFILSKHLSHTLVVTLAIWGVPAKPAWVSFSFFTIS